MLETLFQWAQWLSRWRKGLLIVLLAVVVVLPVSLLHPELSHFDQLPIGLLVVGLWCLWALALVYNFRHLPSLPGDRATFRVRLAYRLRRWAMVGLAVLFAVTTVVVGYISLKLVSIGWLR